MTIVHSLGRRITMSDETNPAETYEAYMVPALFGPWALRLTRSARLREGERVIDRVIDVGCGTGIVAREASRQVGATGRVVGIDASPQMLTVARVCAEREQLMIEWQEGRAEELPLADGAFDAATCQFALMFFEDQSAALHELRRVLSPDGRAVLAVFQPIDRHPFYVALDEAIQERLGVSAAADIFSLGDQDQLGRMVRDAGFAKVTIEHASLLSRFPEPAAFLAGEIDVDTASIPAMQGLTAEERATVLRDIGERMQEPLRQVTDGDEVALEFHVLLVTATPS